MLLLQRRKYDPSIKKTDFGHIKFAANKAPDTGGFRGAQSPERDPPELAMTWSILTFEQQIRKIYLYRHICHAKMFETVFL